LVVKLQKPSSASRGIEPRFGQQDARKPFWLLVTGSRTYTLQGSSSPSSHAAKMYSNHLARGTSPFYELGRELDREVAAFNGVALVTDPVNEMAYLRKQTARNRRVA
jgi:hypothetical protein